MKTRITVIIIALLTLNNLSSQNVAINDNGAVANTHAILDIDVAANNKGVLIPRLTTAQRTGIAGLGAADEGLTVYDQTTDTFWYWDGTQWVEIPTGGAAGWLTVGNAGTNPATNFAGTTDNQDFVIRTNNVEKMRVMSAGNVGIGTNNPNYKVVVSTTLASDGLAIDALAANGDPLVQFRLNGTSIITMGVDDSDADKFKIGTTAITTNTRLTIQTNGFIGINTTTPGNMLNMTNGAVAVGATSMANFDNSGVSGVAISGRNSNTTSGYNAIEGITDYNGTAFIPAGVFGLAIYNGAANAPTIGVRGASNEWQGTGVRGSRFNGGGPNTGWGGEFYDDLGYTGFFGTISDERTKIDVQSINGALGIIAKLNPVTYHFDLDKYPNMGLNREMEYGFIAQEVRNVLPEITRLKTFDPNSCIEQQPNGLNKNEKETFVAMDYTRIIPILTKAIQEQQEMIENQNQEIQDLRKRIEQLEEK